MRAIRRLAELGMFLVAPRRSVRYVGVLDICNLGDQAVYQAARQYFSPVPVLQCAPPGHPRWLRQWVEQKPQAVVMLGGGTLIGRGSKHGNAPLEEFERAANRGARRIVFGTGVSGADFESADESRSDMLRRWKQVLGTAAYVGVRGPDSAAALRSWGIGAEMIGDLACRFAQPRSFWQPPERVLGINFGRSDVKFSGLAAALRQIIESRRRNGWGIDFFVVWPEDLEPTRQLAESAGVPGAAVHQIYLDANAYLARVRRVRALVGLKLHAVILALCAGVPSLMLDYNPKCLDFMRSVGLADFDLPIRSASFEALDALLERLLADDEPWERASRHLLEYRRLQEHAAARCISGLLKR